MRRPLRFAVLAAALALVCAVPAQASPLLLGQTVQYQYLFPCITCNYSSASNGNYVVGAGVEVSNIVDSRGTLDISDRNLYFDFVSGGSFTSSAFNGFRITDIFGVIPSFTGVTINAATNMVGLNASRITFDDNNIWVNWTDLAFNANTVVSLDIEGGGGNMVPDPGSSLLLLGLGLAGLRGLRQRLG
jgi:hypothetical protein